MPSPTLAEISGPAGAMDGDTPEVAAERVRLYGVDARELNPARREWTHRAGNPG